MNKDFTEFQKEFKKWQQKFGLTGYKVYFEHKPLDDCFANITGNEGSQVVTVSLNSDDGEHTPFRHVKVSAKHEAIHLLLHRFDTNARYRWATQAELDEAVEELVFKLEDLIV